MLYDTTKDNAVRINTIQYKKYLLFSVTPTTACRLMNREKRKKKKEKRKEKKKRKKDGHTHARTHTHTHARTHTQPNQTKSKQTHSPIVTHVRNYIFPVSYGYKLQVFC